MSNYAVINLKTDPELKALAVKVADQLGVSISAVLNNELRRFAVEQRVEFELPEVPNDATAATMKRSRAAIEKGDYHSFASDKDALNFLADELS